MTVTLVDSMGSDLSVVNAARVSFGQTSGELDERDRGLIAFLMREKHASPFEHCVMSVHVRTSIAVAREWMRHRTQSFNEFSTRYSKVDDPAFYLPEPGHVRTQKGKPGAYRFETIDDPAAVAQAQATMDEAYGAAAAAYDRLVAAGVAREVARNVLPLGMETQFYATANLRNWLNFLSLRTAPAALREIRDEACQAEAHLQCLFPVTYSAWAESGRGQI